jgi:ComEC/Rec2-related protein
MGEDKLTSETFWRGSPLVPAAALFLAGLVLGIRESISAPFLLAGAAVALGFWIMAESAGRRLAAHLSLAGLLLCAGASLGALNQRHVEPMHVARFVGDEPRMAALRVRVEVPPENARSHGNQYWIARARQLDTDRGWLPAAGDLQIQWAGEGGIELRRGMEVELQGWLERPETAQNPGAFDARRMLAADRVFVQMRVPRAAGVRLLDDSDAAGPGWIERMRAFLRGKLLEHMIQRDVRPALTLTALLLGYRDRAVADVSQSFADAGIAHLLAISGSHIVFFTTIAWLLLRHLPMRPRLREVLIAAVVMLYVLATPCGPPIIRAAVALLMVILARMLGRPRAYLNILAGAAIVVVLIRPMDIADAGFQLSFVTTAALILFSGRIHAALFERMLAREELAADLARTRLARWRYAIMRFAAGALVANAIGAVSAAPLVAFHFGQLNAWAVVSGIIAFPFVSAAMIVAALQLLASLVGLGAWVEPLATLCGNGLIWIVQKLASLPGAAAAIRAPEMWLVLAAYGVLLLWALRRQVRLSRAAMINTAVAFLVVTAAWYAWSAPRQTRITVLRTGTGDCILVRTPRGAWAIDAGAEFGTSLVDSAIRPSLRIAGVRRLDGFLLRALDSSHAQEAGRLMEAARPAETWLDADAWARRGQTLAGAQVAAAAEQFRLPVKPLAAGEALVLGDDCRIEVLGSPGQPLILRITAGNHRILLLDPKSDVPLFTLPEESLRCDLVLFTGPRRGSADAALLRHAAELGAKQTIWCGSGSWAPRTPLPHEWNTAQGAVGIDCAPAGLQVFRAR